ncbi:MAG TPA: ZIP family metal transporter [Gemmatimonadales bacterium]|nr:ZIP family metal transporter [Gemmatimonadales bacterium]
MISVSPAALALAAAAAAGNLLGAMAVVRHHRRELTIIELGIAFGAGFMLAVAVLGVLPVVFQANPRGAVYVLAGYLAVHLAQHVVIPHFHFGEETHRVSGFTGITALFGLSLHTFFDGVAIASGFLVSGRLGLLLFLAVLVHKLPEGVTIASIMLAGGQSKASAVWSGVWLGVATLLGVVLTEGIAPLARHGLALSAGVTLYVAASNLVPEFQSRRGAAIALAFFGGLGAYAVSDWLIGLWLG